jgi:hypothetical protein
MKLFIMALLVMMPHVVFAECRVVEYGDRNEVECSGEPVSDAAKEAMIKERDAKEKQAITDEHQMMFDACKKEIGYNLKSPATAIYSLARSRWAYQGKAISLSVDAQNGYGALIREQFVCHFDHVMKVSYFEKEERL